MKESDENLSCDATLCLLQTSEVHVGLLFPTQHKSQSHRSHKEQLKNNNKQDKWPSLCICWAGSPWLQQSSVRSSQRNSWWRQLHSQGNTWWYWRAPCRHEDMRGWPPEKTLCNGLFFFLFNTAIYRTRDRIRIIELESQLVLIDLVWLPLWENLLN